LKTDALLSAQGWDALDRNAVREMTRTRGSNGASFERDPVPPWRLNCDCPESGVD
jgi:hypothetical protein